MDQLRACSPVATKGFQAQALLLGSILAALILLAVIGVSIWQMRAETWKRAELAGTNLARAISAHVDQHIQVYDAALRFIMLELGDIDAGDAQPVDQHILANLASSMNFVGSILVLNANGDIVADSAVHRRSANFSDRDYFEVHRDSAIVGTYISQPYQSRLRNGEWSIAISRRISKPDGSFDGVVLAAIRIEFIRSFLQLIGLQPNDVLVLVTNEGRIVAGSRLSMVTVTLAWMSRRAQISSVFVPRAPGHSRQSPASTRLRVFTVSLRCRGLISSSMSA